MLRNSLAQCHFPHPILENPNHITHHFPLLPGPLPLARVRSLTHYGEPYDGNTRFFRPSLFTAAVRASYGEACLLHGTDWMPPKVCVGPSTRSACWAGWHQLASVGVGWQCGVTEEQMLRMACAARNTELIPPEPSG